LCLDEGVHLTIELHKESLAIAREIGNRHGEVLTLHHLGIDYSAQGQIEPAISFYEQARTVACEIGDRRRESYGLLGLGRSLLGNGNLSEAKLRCEEACRLDMPETDYQAALILGIVLLNQQNPAARNVFVSAIARCEALLNKTAGLYEAQFTLAAALVGQAVCDPCWADTSQRAELLAPALAEYRQALQNCAAPGVVADALRDLELIYSAGMEGLEPVSDLLKSASG
jgi:tetratricopeptide (TPR) repeat protein